jgi:hypothetical protein
MARYVHFTSSKHKGEKLADHAVDVWHHVKDKWPLHYDLVPRHGGSYEHNTFYMATKHADEAHSLRRHVEKHFPHLKHVATTTTPKLPKQK